MDLNYLKKLLKIVNDSGVDEVEIEEEGSKVRVKKSPSVAESSMPQFLPFSMPAAAQVVQPAAPVAAPTPVLEKKLEKVGEEKAVSYYEVKSPIVGTFYRAPSPDAEPYIKVGDVVSPGQVLCIIEAMKLMNEIESEVSGKIVKILIDNAKPVEYGQTLFLVDKS
ncbi:MAG: acetyl-CoA carboxylase biotin carboxyl carrier protein [Ignavibacteria bacterium]|nr:acetyl-CoA carboxylase biotin carboxyl carrier protein [Ignavibacteria bacterium]